jgi:hypothetical protein
MKAILVYRNPDCAKCTRLARIHHRFDWLKRLEDTTEVPSTGPLRPGEIAVQDLASGENAQRRRVLQATLQARSSRQSFL